MTNSEIDRQIVQLHQNGGREEAFESFVRQYKPSLYALCYRMMQNAEDAAEAWQEVLLQVDRSLGNFRNESSLYTWAYRIALNVCSNLRRRLSREAARAAVDLTSAESLPSEQAFSNPDAFCQKAFKRQLVQKNLRRLPATQRTVLILHNLEGFTLKEIAAMLGLKENAVKARLRRASAAFKNLLEEDFENLGVALPGAASVACASKLN